MILGKSIVFIEGPSGVGKTPTTDFLCTKGFTKYGCLFIPDHFDEYDGFINWDTPYESYAEMMAVSNMHNMGVDIIMDRSPLSWCIYNNNLQSHVIEDMVRWINLLLKWESATVVCLSTSRANLIKNAEKKGLKYPNNLVEYDEYFDRIPEHMRLDYHILNYDSDWREELAGKLMGKIMRDVIE